MLLVGRMTYENASGRLAYCISFGLFLANKIMYRDKVNMSIEGPCCQSARAAVDHAEVQNAKIKAIKSAYRFLSVSNCPIK